MNFIFISPNYPPSYWQFCQRLRESGATVLGIGDAPYFELSEALRNCLTEYYYLNSLHDYEQVYRAVAFFIFKYGRIDWLDSNNGYWTEQDARLRSDFNIRSGPGLDGASAWTGRGEMLARLREAGLPVLRCCAASSAEQVRAFLGQVGGYPIVGKPDAAWTTTEKLDSDSELDAFFMGKPGGTYLFEEWLPGEVVSYDAVTDSAGEPLFESTTVWPHSIANLARSHGDMAYFTCAEIPEELRELGRREVKALNARSRLVHLRFLHVAKYRPGAQYGGEYLALDANLRPADGFLSDMMNFAHSTDIYRIWADMVLHDRRLLPESAGRHWCAYAGRRDHHPYRHSHEEILARYGFRMALCERVPENMPRMMGDQMYIIHAYSEQEVREFISFVQE